MQTSTQPMSATTVTTSAENNRSDELFEYDVDFGADIISMSDITDRVEALREARDALEEAEQEALDALTDAQGNLENSIEADKAADTQAVQEAFNAREQAKAALAAWLESQDARELATLTDILEETRGSGGDHQFEGEWYPGELIAEEHFTDYVQQMLEDCGEVPRGLPWYVEIDWGKTADNLKMDYSEVDIQGFTFLYRT